MTTAGDPLPMIPGYRITYQLYAGSKTSVYQAVREQDQLLVVIKVLFSEYPSFNELLQFRNQYTISKNLNHRAIVNPIALEAYGNSYILVMKDTGFVSLRVYIKETPFSMVEFLEFGINFTHILEHLVENRVIHKDIKPANILIHPQTKEIQLIDFSIASLLPKENQEIKSPNVLEGTLAYISPEQTGRMNRGIDYRSDFYSLGVTFYELLTGELPFTCDQPMELVHCHMAKIPPALGNRKRPIGDQELIPGVIGDMVMKLMAKNAEDRYQSALGLRYDLENCCHQWKNTQKIAYFEIGKRDLCDRFFIPEKLYGRETEVKNLLATFDRVCNGTSEMILVAGFSGVGKTAVVNEVHKPITRRQGYFIKGKFDQFNRNIPFSAFVQALQDLINQLWSESDQRLQQWRTNILAALGDSGQVLIDVIPELEKIIGKQPPVRELSGIADQNRFNLLFKKFIEVFTTAEHPVVIFLDDLQWADLASLELIKLLIEDENYLLLLGAYRDNEVHPTHPLMLLLHELRKTTKTINTITLNPLSFADVNQLVADTLNCPQERSQTLTDLIQRKTQGNPFFITQFLKSLHQDGHIKFNTSQGFWESDLTQIKALSITDDVVRFMSQQLLKLPKPTQNVLQLAACIGNHFDLATLAVVCQQSPVNTATDLWKGVENGLILPTSQVYKFFQTEIIESQRIIHDQGVNLTYRFLHDRVQQAAYGLIPDEEKQLTHLKIGQLLLHHTSQENLESRIFDIVNQLNMGIDLISQLGQKKQLAKLNLRAGEKAKLATAYDAAATYFQKGLLLLSNNWESDYTLTLKLHELLAEAQYLNTNFASSEEIINETLTYAQTSLDKIKVYEIQIQSYTAQNKLVEAIKVGREALELLGIDLPNQVHRETINLQHQQIKNILGHRPIENLANLPLLVDSVHRAALRILAGLFASVYLAQPELLPLYIFTMVKICLEYGNSPQAAIAYSLYGLFLCASGEIDRGYKFGQLATILVEKLEAKELNSKINLIFGLFVKHWQDSLSSTLPVFLAGLKSGLEHGDIEYVAYCANCYIQFLFCSGETLELVESEGYKYAELIASVKQESAYIWVNTWRQTVMNLRGKCENTTILVGSCFNEAVSLPFLIESQNINGICFVYLAKLLLYYLFGDYQKAQEYADKFGEYEQGAAGLWIIPLKNFYQSLTLLALYSQMDQENKTASLIKIANNQKFMKTWAHHAPMNYWHKFHLVEAETYRVLGKNYQAGDSYDQAIALAQEYSYLQEQALSNELAAKFYLQLKKDKIAAGYMQEAYYCYARWNSEGKMKDLETRYPELLRPILIKPNLGFNPLETLAGISPGVSIHAPNTVKRSSSSSINNTLDFAAILKASQSLSSTIQLNELLNQLTQIILQNSGADYCSLVLPDSHNNWGVKAVATETTTELCFQPLQNNLNAAVKLIQYVKNTQQIVVIDDLNTDIAVIDEYLTQQQPKSVLCLPIHNQGNLIGILYLQNSSTSGVFTSDRIIILNFLCTQAAISLENARLYQQAGQALQDLQAAQLQIIQNEKMFALGNLVAGVAHEMNNPLGFISASLEQIKPIINDIITHLQLYQSSLPTPESTPQNQINQNQILDHAEEIDLDYILADLPKMVNSIIMACDRLKNISNSLRTFSRADRDYKVLFNIHEGLDSTILILKHRLKANQRRPAIEVITEYGDLPKIECFPGQLNQVFMNIIANAIDALEESNHQRSFEEIKATPNYIWIKTSVINDQIQIIVADNGVGMSEQIKQRVFDHLFTTKAVGKGTGLGLAIAQQIVVEKHNGTIKVNSTPDLGTEFIITLPIAV